MAVSFVSQSNQTDDGTSPNSGLPSGSGGMLLWEVSYEKGQDIGVTLPSGFTLINTVVQAANVGKTVAWKIAAGSDAVTGTFSQAAKYSVTCSRWAGAHASAPIRANASTSFASGHPDPANLTGIVAGDMVLAIVSGKTQTLYSAAPTGYTECYDNPNTSGGVPSDCLANKEAAGTSDNPSAFTAVSTSEWVALTIALIPAAGGQAAPPRADHQYRLRRV